jgi:catalase (peroxidase I)
MLGLVLCFLMGLPMAASFVECPNLRMGTPPSSHAEVPTEAEYDKALKALDVESLMIDMKALLTTSMDCWPADFGHYGPFFVRLAWHCSGSYRKIDGRGGCGGGRIRFEPEASWEDNTNLDKARALLYPLKAKYGHALSWGDLFITAGTVALRAMNTPITQLCFGRIDEADGSNSLVLEPSPERPCTIPGQCEEPLGATTHGLIYVNPEGPVNATTGKPVPNPMLSAADVRVTFERMGADDRGTVALIGGGHAFGKTHGACPDGPGDPPKVAYANSAIPWKGLCGTGKGDDTYTSGFEGPWTRNPTTWDNEYFKLLLNEEWVQHTGPGGHTQWKIKNATSGDEKLIMLTADLALLYDEKYKKIVEEFAADEKALGKAFDAAWFRLTTTNGNVWSQEAKCDSGTFPEELRSMDGMLGTDSGSVNQVGIWPCFALLMTLSMFVM